jgi:NADPH-dependent 2,4-dienoyl-CoA reductase/sulfur reductase-like enzyme/rubredoxin
MYLKKIYVNGFKSFAEKTEIDVEMFKEIKEEKKEVEDKKVFKWKCTVCGEIVEGEEPPEKCPVCGVGPKYFIKVEETEEEETSDDKENIVIIGASGAGMGAAVEIRKRNKVSDITILSKEDVKGYFRPQLTKLLSRDDVTLDEIAIKNDDWFRENNVKLLLDKVVDRIDPKNSKLILGDKEEIPYTKLIIASGAEVFVPPFPGRDKKGVFTLRYIKDSIEIKSYAKDKRTAAVIGGGVLGLEAANELNKMGLKVTVIEMADRILPRQLDKDASVILEQIVEEAGVNFLKGAGTKEILGDEAVRGILLDNGEIVDADVVIISTGVKANTEIAKDTGIEIKRAIVVNEKMETSVSGIYACGDCAEFEGINYALWSEAIEQGKAAGINAVLGVASKNYSDPMLSRTHDISSADLCMVVRNEDVNRILNPDQDSRVLSVAFELGTISFSQLPPMNTGNNLVMGNQRQLYDALKSRSVNAVIGVKESIIYMLEEDGTSDPYTIVHNYISSLFKCP